MKYFAAFLLIVFSACQSSQSEVSSSLTIAEKQIAKNLIQGAFDDLWSAADSNKISKYHTDDFIILEHGEVWDNDRIKKFMRNKIARNSQTKRTNKMDYISIDKYGESIQMTYYNYAEFWQADTLAGKASWLESALAVKTASGWKLKMMHSTRMKKQ